MRNGFRALTVAAGYYACAHIGTALSVPPSGFAIIWPATAFLISVLLLGGRMEVNSRRRGTSVHVAIPLPADKMKRTPRAAVGGCQALGRSGAGREGG